MKRLYVIAIAFLLLPTISLAARDSTRSDTTVFQRGKTILPRSTVNAIPEDSVKWGTWANPFESVTGDTVSVKRYIKSTRGRIDSLSVKDSLSVGILRAITPDTTGSGKWGHANIQSGAVDSLQFRTLGKANVDTMNTGIKWGHLNIQLGASDSTQITKIGAQNLQLGIVDSVNIRKIGAQNLQLGIVDSVNIRKIGNQNIQLGSVDSTQIRKIGNQNLQVNIVDSTIIRPSSLSGSSLALVLGGVHTWTGKNSWTAMPNLPDSGITFTSDPNTRLAWLGPDSLAIVTGGTARIVVGSTTTTSIPGSLLLGATGNASYALHVVGTSYVSSTALFGATVQADRLYAENNTTGTTVGHFYQKHADGYGVFIQIDNADADKYALNVAPNSGTSALYVQNNGNVGIGTATPTSFVLQVAGNVGPNATQTSDLGSVAASWDSLFIHHAAVVGDIPYLDTQDDVALIKGIQKSTITDSITGLVRVDDKTLPKQILYLHSTAGVDTLVTNKKYRTDTIVKTRQDTVTKIPLLLKAIRDTTLKQVLVSADTTIRAHQKGDPVTTVDGKPFFLVENALGLLFGAVKQLDAERSGLSAWVLSLQKRIEALEAN